MPLSLKNKGSNTDPNNYRPISVIGHIPKCFEKMVDVQFQEYLLAHSFLHKVILHL